MTLLFRRVNRKDINRLDILLLSAQTVMLKCIFIEIRNKSWSRLINLKEKKPGTFSLMFYETRWYVFYQKDNLIYSFALFSREKNVLIYGNLCLK